MNDPVTPIGAFKRNPGRRGWNALDGPITGWTRYWNEILQPEEPLDPNVVKALIASESSLSKNPSKNRKTALGLLQLKPKTIQILSGQTSDLKDHIVEFTVDLAGDESVALAAGIRWLFEKKRLASHRLKREASWREAIAEYKGYLKQLLAQKPAKGMQVFDQYLEELSEYVSQ